MKLSGQVALVTGGSGAIGSEICRMLAAEGTSVVVQYNHSVAKAEQVCQSIHVSGGNAIAIQADLTQEPQVQRLVQETIQQWGRLNILINNAGWTRVVSPKDLVGLDDEVINKTLALKIHAPLYCLRAALDHLRDTGNGHVVNVTSAAGIAARGSSMIYSAANAALSTLTRTWALTFGPSIRVNAVAPGFVDTGFAYEERIAYANRVAMNNHLGRVVSAAEIADAIRFLCLNSAITGEELLVDGGIARLGKKT